MSEAKLQYRILADCRAEWGKLISCQIKLRREWTLFDKTTVWKQILLHTGAR